MPITTATLSINSSDLLSDTLALSTTSTLTKAGTRTGLSETSGLARKTLSFDSSGVIDTTVLFRGDDYSTNGANKLYIKNTSTVSSEYVTLYLTGHTADGAHDATDPTITGLTEVGRLYAGDFAFFPWNAKVEQKKLLPVRLLILGLLEIL